MPAQQKEARSSQLHLWEDQAELGDSLIGEEGEGEGKEHLLTGRDTCVLQTPGTEVRVHREAGGEGGDGWAGNVGEKG